LCNNLELIIFCVSHIRDMCEQSQRELFSLNQDSNKFHAYVWDITSLKDWRIRLRSAIFFFYRWCFKIYFAISHSSNFPTRFQDPALMCVQLHKNTSNNETICHRNKTTLKFMLSSYLLPFNSEVEIFKFFFFQFSSYPP
jgi:hypothetical protein